MEKITRPMKMKMIFMFAFALSTILLHAGDLRANMNKRGTSNHKQTGINVTAGSRPYDALIGRFNGPWPFGQESNQD